MAAPRIIFMGTPDFAGESLRALIGSNCFQVLAVVCQPDQPAGRGLKLQAPPTKKIALDQNIPVLQPERARDENFLRQLRDLQPDVIAVTAYGQILPGSILQLPPHGCLNVHASLLPKYRGAAPIQWALLNGDTDTGVTIMKMDAGMDTGAILSQEKIPILAEDNSRTLHDRLSRAGAGLLVKTISEYLEGRVQPRPQPVEGVVYAPKIQKKDGQIDWHQPARLIWNRVRAMVPWPGAFTHLQVLQRREFLKIWASEIADESGPHGRVIRADKDGIVVACGSQSLRLLQVQLEGGRRMSAQEFLAGHPLHAGDPVG